MLTLSTYKDMLTLSTWASDPAPFKLKGASVSASQSQIIAGIAAIVEEVTGIEPEEVTVGKSFVDDLDIDSLSIVEIVVQLEDKYGVKIADEDIQQLSTVGDAVAFVQRMEIENPAVAERLKATLDDSN